MWITVPPAFRQPSTVLHIVATTDHVDSASAEKAETVQRAGFFADGSEPSASSVSHVRIEVGDGETYPQYGDTLYMHYRGMLAEDGTEFSTSQAGGAASL